MYRLSVCLSLSICDFTRLMFWFKVKTKIFLGISKFKFPSFSIGKVNRLMCMLLCLPLTNEWKAQSHVGNAFWFAGILNMWKETNLWILKAPPQIQIRESEQNVKSNKGFHWLQYFFFFNPTYYVWVMLVRTGSSALDTNSSQYLRKMELR